MIRHWTGSATCSGLRVQVRILKAG
jgi:hypothetical protein